MRSLLLPNLTASGPVQNPISKEGALATEMMRPLSPALTPLLLPSSMMKGVAA